MAKSPSIFVVEIGQFFSPIFLLGAIVAIISTAINGENIAPKLIAYAITVCVLTVLSIIVFVVARKKINNLDMSEDEFINLMSGIPDDTPAGQPEESFI